MEAYRSKHNLELEAKRRPVVVELTKQMGECQFQIDANSSVRLTQSYPTPFIKVPLVFTSLTIDSADFPLYSSLTSKTDKGFICCIENISSAPITGILSWVAMV
jgi:hypothetical protein